MRVSNGPPYVSFGRAMRRTAFWAIAIGLGAAAGCSDGTTDGEPGGAGGGDNQQTGGAGGTDSGTDTGTGHGSGSECEEGPGFADDTPARSISSVTGRIVDTDGNPLSDVPVQLCGTDLCFIGKTGADGSVMECKSGVCSDGFTPSGAMKDPAFKHGRGANYARFAYLLPDGDDFDLGDVTALPIPAPGEGAVLEAGKSATSGGVTLTLAEGTEIEASLDFISDDEKQFRAATMNPEDAPAAVSADLGLEIVVGMAPFDTTVCPGAKVSLDNTQGWAPGTEVEFLLHGLSVLEEWAPYAGWAVIGTGAVSEDGATIAMDDDSELRELSTLGVRRK